MKKNNKLERESDKDDKEREDRKYEKDVKN